MSPSLERISHHKSSHYELVQEPEDTVYAASGSDIRSGGDLETAVVKEYDEYSKLAFESMPAKRFSSTVKMSNSNF